MKTKKALIVTIIAVSGLIFAACGKDNGIVSTSTEDTAVAQDSAESKKKDNVSSKEYTKEELLAMPEEVASNFEYEMLEDESGIRITNGGTDNEDGVLIIPAQIDGKNVVSIGKAFFNDKKLRYVVVPEGVLSIGEDAFNLSSNIKMAVLPVSLKEIDATSFDFSKKEVTLITPKGSYAEQYYQEQIDEWDYATFSEIIAK